MLKNIKIVFKQLSFMRNKFQTDEIPICSNCVHFIETPDPTFKRYGKCKKFTNVDIVSGELDNEFAKKCRDSIKYGLFGSEHIDKNQNKS